MNSGPSAAKVEAEWDRIRGAGDQPIYTLRLIDWSGTAMAGFGPDELNDTHDLRYRLLRLWGDVLQVRSHKHLQKLLETSGSEA